MTSYLYKPNHPMADKRGFVIKEHYYEYKWQREEDKRMFRGNEPVVLNYIPDGMPATRHMALPPNAAPIDSKSKFRKVTKERGCIEIGNEIPTMLKPRKPVKLDRRERREAIRTAIRDLKEERMPPQELHAIREHGKRTDYINRNRRRSA